MANTRQMMSMIAALLSLLAVLLAIISRFTMKTIVISQDSYMLFATVAILFAIYFRLGRMNER